MISSPLPKIRDLFLIKNNNNLDNDNFKIYTSGSAASLNMLFEALILEKNKAKLKVAIPCFFCQETLNNIENNNIEICFYKLDSYLDPDMSDLKLLCLNDIDVILCVHFFGKLHEFNNVRTLCVQKGILLIEDCAHVLKKDKYFSKYGDVSIFSPHKLLPIPDGGEIFFSKKSTIGKRLYIYIKSKIDIDKNNFCIKWRLKKIIQKLIHIEKKNNFYFGIHYGKSIAINTHKNMSGYAMSILSKYTEVDLQHILYRRKKNLRIINKLMYDITHDIIPLTPDDTEQPYMAVYSMQNISEKKQLLSKVEQFNLPISYWPDMPLEISGDRYNSIINLASNIITIPIHQDVKTEYLIKNFYQRNDISEKHNEYFNICFLTECEKNKYIELYKKMRYVNIPQDWDYGDVKQNVEHWNVKRAIIYDEVGNEIGVVQILEKRILGITVAVRVNRGPLFLEKYDNVANHMRVMRYLKKYYGRVTAFFYAPQICDNVNSLIQMQKNDWNIENLHGFSSGMIDLSKEVESSLYIRLESKWRNQLKSSQKASTEILHDFKRFEEILSLYEKNQQEKEYKGISRNILLAMRNKSKLALSYIEDESKNIIAFDIFYVTHNLGLYLVGWNSPLGRKCYANNLMLYDQMLTFLNQKVRWFDLGGIDFVCTPENAKFKMGMNPDVYELLGEFYSYQ